MIITHYGLEFFKVQFGDLVIGINPFPSGKKFGADIALVSLPQKDFSSVENLAYGEKTPFLINTAGEYEVKGVSIRGFNIQTTFQGKEAFNTIFLLSLEEMKLCFLGALGKPHLPPEAKEHVEEVDILFAPIGGGDVLSPAEAYKLSVELSAKIIIPMHYSESDEKQLETFLKEGGEGDSGKIAPIEKLTIKRKDLAGKEGEIVVLTH